MIPILISGMRQAWRGETTVSRRDAVGSNLLSAWKATSVAPTDLVRGPVLIAAPHPDDEVLGCGELIVSLAAVDPAAVTVAVATNGDLSPRLPGRVPEEGLADVRSRESAKALARLCLPPERLTFFGLPDGNLRACRTRLEEALAEAVRQSKARELFVPFRYDSHPDHMALHAAGVRVATACPGLDLFEYFVYPRWRLLRAGDVRCYLAPGELLALDASATAAVAKREALDEYRSQTTLWIQGQKRPILFPALLDRICAEAETFVRYDPRRRGAGIFSGSALWFRLVLRVEPPLKRWKDRECERIGWSQ